MQTSSVPELNGQMGEEYPPKNTVWLASYPKSGNTWMRAMFSAYINHGEVDINILVGTFGDQDGYYLNAVAPRPTAEIGYIERLLLRPAQLLHMQETCLFSPTVVKTHTINQVIESYPTVPHHLTRGAFVIVRDPRDVVISYADHMGQSIDEAIASMADTGMGLKTDAGHVKTVYGSWSNHVASWLGGTRFPVNMITYEDMLKDQEWALKKFLETIGWKPDDKRVAMAVEACEFSKLRTQEDDKDFTERSPHSKRFFRSGTTGQWENELTDKQVQSIESDHGEIMGRLGYELTMKQEAA